MTRRVSTILPLVLALAAAASSSAGQAASPRPPGPPDQTPLANPPAAPAGDGTGVRMTTTLGDIVIGLFTESSPVAAHNFLNLAEAGFYVGTTFHRIVPGFVIQGGDPAGDGTGGPGYTIPDEPVVGSYGRGIAAMARTDAPDSQESQFFIVLTDAGAGSLEYYRTYAIFGEVVEGMDVVDAIAATPNSGKPDNRALQPVPITATSVEQVTLPAEPTGVPAPTSGDPELEARFPRSLGGQPLDVSSYTGPELIATLDPSDPSVQASVAQIQGILAKQGRTIDDFSIAGGTLGEGTDLFRVAALRVKGADPNAFIDTLLPLMLGIADPQRAPAQVGDKDVVGFTDGPASAGGSPIYVYPVDDMLWAATGPDALLAELFGALP